VDETVAEIRLLREVSSWLFCYM